MLPIKYPADRVKFNQSYVDKLAPYIDNSINTTLKKITHPDGKPLSWQKLIVSSFSQLPQIFAAIKKLSDTDRALLHPLTSYEDRQKEIAEFFMGETELGLFSCYYCNIDTIYSFSEIGDYQNGLDFIKRADFHELQQITGIGPGKARVIVASRATKMFVDLADCPVSHTIRTRIKTFAKPYTHNHFTLDHFYHKATEKELSLCLYNLVPCCYVCNSKFKGTNKLYTNDPIYSSPSSEDYSFHQDVSFKMYFHLDEDSTHNLKDFAVEMEINKNKESHAQYISLLKIRGRYAPFKHEALNLLQLKRKYPESKLREMAKEAGLPVDEVRRDVFGQELFDAKYDQHSLVKYKRDIAKNIKLLI